VKCKSRNKSTIERKRSTKSNEYITLSIKKTYNKKYILIKNKSKDSPKGPIYFDFMLFVFISPVVGGGFTVLF